MRRLLLVVTLLLPAFTFGQGKPLYTVYTGFQKGTYALIAEDIQKACPQFQINVEPTQGSLANINALIAPPVIKNGHRLALVQKDALDAILGSEPKAKTVYKMVMPFYSEEITIIANKKSGIKTLKDLNGKRVASGLPGSGMWFTANTIRNALNIKWLQVDRLPEESILLVLTGEVDAMLIVGGSPVRLFQELGQSMAERILMIPITETEFEKVYQPARIPALTYLWQDYPVETKATQSILIAAADVPDNAIKEFNSCLAKNLSAIKKFGHPKWKEINFPPQNLRQNQRPLLPQPRQK
jgi:TRAP transporter TAXI family solute receptor